MEVVDSREVNITLADATQWPIQGLEEGSLYRFLLSGCTRAGCGPPLVQESVTVTQAREYQLQEAFLTPPKRETLVELGLAAVMSSATSLGSHLRNSLSLATLNCKLKENDLLLLPLYYI